MIIVNFLRGLFNESGAVSSKRFAGIEVLQVVLVMVLANQFTEYKLDKGVLITLLGFVVACFGLNAALQYKSMDVKKSVASDMVTATGDNDSAKETMQSDKPGA